MTRLKQAALRATVLPRETVENYHAWYTTYHPDFAALCESHERLRMELAGAEEQLEIMYSHELEKLKSI